MSTDRFRYKGEKEEQIRPSSVMEPQEPIDLDNLPPPTIKNLSQFRKLAGLSMRALASLLQISPSYIQKMESGSATPSAALARRLKSVSMELFGRPVIPTHWDQHGNNPIPDLPVLPKKQDVNSRPSVSEDDVSVNAASLSENWDTMMSHLDQAQSGLEHLLSSAKQVEAFRGREKAYLDLFEMLVASCRSVGEADLLNNLFDHAAERFVRQYKGDAAVLLDLAQLRMLLAKAKAAFSEPDGCCPRDLVESGL